MRNVGIRDAILEKDYLRIEQVLNSYLHVLCLAEEKGATIRKFRDQRLTKCGM